MVTFNRMNNSTFATPQEYDSYLSDPYYNTPTDEYVTNMADEPWGDENLDNMGEGGQIPVLSVGEYEKELLSQAKQIRSDQSLSPSDKKLILDRINKLLNNLKKFSNHESPSPEVLSEIETFQMDMMDRAAQAMEEKNAQYEEVYGKLGELRAGVEGGEGSESTYSLTDEQRKDILTQIDQMMHSLDLGEKPEEISKKLETLETQLSENVIDDKTQIFLSLFTDPPVTIQELKDAGIFDEIKNNHGEMPSEKVMQFLAEHDSALKGMISNEDQVGAMERIGALLSEGFGIEVGIPEEEEASKYGLSKQDALLKLGSKIYAVDISNQQLKMEKAEKMKEADLAKENMADQLANMPGMYDVTAEDILKKADELGFDLANFPPSPTPEVFNFLTHISPKLQKAIESWWSTGADGAGEAVRNALVDGLQCLYGKEMVQIDTTSKHSGDDIIWAGSAHDAMKNRDDLDSGAIVIGDYNTYASIFRLIDGDG